MSDDEDWVDPSWLSEVETVVDEELKFKNLDVIRGWAVKLEFNKDGAHRHGSGFFVRVPQDDSDTLYDVIFTAAHNLTTTNGIRTTNLQVFYADPEVKQGNAITYNVKTHNVSDPNDVYWCPDYKSEDVPQSDYGFIRIPRVATNRRRGFGFSIPLAYQSYFRGNMYISGFQDETQPGYPILASGECRECYQNLVEYDIKTQPGLSGSGVWLVYKDGLVAVAIQYALSCP
jgi:V8-like Glu-specific endopeptidase